MTRLTFSEALNVATEASAAKPLDLIEAKRVLSNSIDEAYRGLGRLNDEIRKRSAFPLEVAAE